MSLSLIKKIISRRIKFYHSATMCEEKKQISNFAFLDLETTGLPSHENNKTRITEISISIVESKHISVGVYPRVINKLNLCLNPCRTISPSSTTITGLANDLLENQSHFSLDVLNIINDFLKLSKKPICLVAHNGYKFDYPILRAELIRVGGYFPEDLLCIDSLLCFQDLHNQDNLKVHNDIVLSTNKREIDALPVTSQNFEEVDSSILLIQGYKKRQLDGIPIEFSDDIDQILCKTVDEYEVSTKRKKIQKLLETTPKKQMIKAPQLKGNCSTSELRKRTSFKLGDIYKRLTFKDPLNAHNASGDVECLVHCAAVYGEEFVSWSNRNAKLFLDIPLMKPGTRIGY